MKQFWVRTCQECLHRQVTKSPEGQKSDAWRDMKCRRCGSSGLDYGSPGWIRDTDGKLVREDDASWAPLPGDDAS